MFEEDAPRPKREYLLGQPLDTLSVDELTETIERLRAEIARLEAARNAKAGAIDAAQGLFRKT